MRTVFAAYADVAGLAASLPIYYQTVTEGYRLWAVGDGLVLWGHAAGSDANDFDANHKSLATEVSGVDEAIWRGTAYVQRRLAAPRTNDGKPIVMPALLPGGVYYYVTGAGDSENARGNGESCGVQVSGTGASDPAPVDVDFLDSVYLEGGMLMWANAVCGDYASMELVIPATDATPNGQSSGNVNRVAIGGGAHLLVPSPGQGSHDVDLATAVPVPSYNEETGQSSGYWAWSDPPTGRGTLSAAATPGTGAWNLLDFAPNPVRFINRFPLLGSGAIDLKPPIKPKKILPHWKLRMRVHSAGRPSGTLDVVWAYKTGRAVTS